MIKRHLVKNRIVLVVGVIMILVAMIVIALVIASTGTSNGIDWVSVQDGGREITDIKWQDGKMYINMQWRIVEIDFTQPDYPRKYFETEYTVEEFLKLDRNGDPIYTTIDESHQNLGIVFGDQINLISSTPHERGMWGTTSNNSGDYFMVSRKRYYVGDEVEVFIYKTGNSFLELVELKHIDSYLPGHLKFASHGDYFLYDDIYDGPVFYDLSKGFERVKELDRGILENSRRVAFTSDLKLLSVNAHKNTKNDTLRYIAMKNLETRDIISVLDSEDYDADVLEFSPGGRYLSMVLGSDIWLYDIGTNKTKGLGADLGNYLLFNKLENLYSIHTGYEVKVYATESCKLIFETRIPDLMMEAQGIGE